MKPYRVVTYKGHYPTNYHHVLSHLYVSKPKGFICENLVEGYVMSYLIPIKGGLKSPPTLFIHYFYFLLDIIYSEKNPSDAIYRTIFLTFHIPKYGHYTMTSGNLWEDLHSFII